RPLPSALQRRRHRTRMLPHLRLRARGASGVTVSTRRPYGLRQRVALRAVTRSRRWRRQPVLASVVIPCPVVQPFPNRLAINPATVRGQARRRLSRRGGHSRHEGLSLAADVEPTRRTRAIPVPSRRRPEFSTTKSTGPTPRVPETTKSVPKGADDPDRARS